MISLGKHNRSLSRTLRYFLENAPFAIAASALPGTVNYGITIILVFVSGFEEAGQFRLLLSVFSLVGLASMIETGKVFISAIVTKDRKAMGSLFIQRLCVLATILLATVIAYSATSLSSMSMSLLWVVALACPIYAFDLYLPTLQAQARFSRLFGLECIKYGVAFAAYLGVFLTIGNVALATISMLAVVATCHMLYFWRITKSCFDWHHSSHRSTNHWKATAARQARTYSFANILPASLEHADKLLVGWIFGLEFLGVYALAYSTGRFFYNALKPALYIYYRQFVETMPGRGTLIQTGLAFSLVGAICAILFLLIVATVPAMAKFAPGTSVTAILFLSYGVGMVRAVYCQAFILHKASEAGQLLRASILASAVSLLLLAWALNATEATALILLALQYPARDGLTTLLLFQFRQSTG